MDIPPLLLGMVAAACCPLALAGALGRRRRRRRREAAAQAGPGRPPAAPAGSLAPSVEDAERELAMVLRRLRAHLRDPGDLQVSRIRDREAFERCLGLAVVLRQRIAALGGAEEEDGPVGHEAHRRRILAGLAAGRGEGS